MKIFFIFIVFAFNSFSNDSKVTEEKIDSYIEQLIKSDDIPALALAVVKNGKVIYQKNFGVSSINGNSNINNKALFPIYSTTKLITTVAIFQLIEQGKLSLEQPIAHYFPDLPINWQAIKVKNLLSHSSGLPDYVDYPTELSDSEMINKLYKDKIQFPIGDKYQYNQTNYWLLTLIIEKITKTSFENFVIENQFQNASQGILYSSNFIGKDPNRITKQVFDSEEQIYLPTTYKDAPRAHSANGLNISLEQLINWNNRLDKNRLLSHESKKRMWSPFLFNNYKDNFLHGWQNYRYSSVGFTGGGISGFRKFIDNDLTIIILTNGFKYKPIINKSIEYIAGIVDAELLNIEKSLNEEVRLSFMTSETNKAIARYQKLKSRNLTFDFSRTLNSIGNYLLTVNKPVEAINVFKINTNENPDIWNAFDSLAKGYFANQQYDLALINYKKSLKLNPKNTKTKKWIDKLEEVTNADYLIQNNVLIKTRDGATISAIVVQKKGSNKPLPVVLQFTIYVRDKGRDMDSLKELADNGYVAVMAYTRGKRFSPDEIWPYEHDGNDAYDVIDWISKQAWSNGSVGMFGGSYNGFSQWAAAKNLHPALKTIVPYVANRPGNGLPMENNIFINPNYEWSFYVSNR